MCSNTEVKQNEGGGGQRGGERKRERKKEYNTAVE